MAALAGLAGAFVLWDPLTIDEQTHLRRLTRHYAEAIRIGLEETLNDKLRSHVRLAQVWRSRQPGSTDAEAVRTAFQHQPGMIAIQWMDAEGRVAYTTGAGDAENHALFVPPDRLPDMRVIAASAAEERAALSRVFESANGREMIALVASTPGTPPGGVLLAIIDVEAALEASLHPYVAPGYSLSVFDGTHEIFRTGDPAPAMERDWGQEATVAVGGITWRVRVWPDSELFGAVRSGLPELAVVLGAMLGVSLLTTWRFGRSAQQSARELTLARDELEQRVQERTESLRHLSGRLLQLQDQERRRIARELHDSTVQVLGAAAVNVDSARQLVSRGDTTRVQDALATGLACLDQAVQDLRTLSYLLHPPMLDELGPKYVLPSYARGFAKRSGLDVSVAIEPEFPRLASEIELAIFRVVQEALTNAHRHSGSPTADIRLEQKDDRIVLEITDQGRGMAEGALDPSELGVGLAGMQERVRELAGHMRVRSGPDGTSLIAEFPAIGPTPDRCSQV